MSGNASAVAIRKARAWLGTAMRAWDPVNAERCREACGLLRETVTQLEVVKRNLESGEALSSVTVMDLTVLTVDAHQLGRLIDAAHAFQRGVAHACPEEMSGSPAALARG